MYTEEEFTVDQLISTITPLLAELPSGPCTENAANLAPCAFDGSMSIKTGCCSKTCAAQLQMLQTGQDCFSHFLSVVCNASPEDQPALQKVSPVLINTARRCLGYQAPATVTCSNGTVLTVPGAATTTTAPSVPVGAAAAAAPAPEARG
eukprot:jgi/Chrzof1/15200/Cz09g31120.t1